MQFLSDLINALSRIAWPTMVAISLLYVLPAMKGVLDRDSGRIEIDIGGNRITVDTASESLSQISELQIELVRLDEEMHDLAHAISLTVPRDESSDDTVPDSAETAAFVEDDHEEITGTPPSRNILWVDDNPTNNAYTLALMRRRGDNVTLASSTEEAMQALAESDAPYDAVITDMGRQEKGKFESTAGTDLITRMRESRDETPVAIFTSKRGADLASDPVLNETSNVSIARTQIDLTRALSKATRQKKAE